MKNVTAVSALAYIVLFFMVAKGEVMAVPTGRYRLRVLSGPGISVGL